MWSDMMPNIDLARLSKALDAGVNVASCRVLCQSGILRGARVPSKNSYGMRCGQCADARKQRPRSISPKAAAGVAVLERGVGFSYFNAEDQLELKWMWCTNLG